MTHASSPARAWLALRAAVLLFGAAGLFGKWLPVSPFNLVFGRTLFAALALAAVLRGRGLRSGAAPGAMVLNGVLLAVHWVTFFQAIQASSVAIGLLGFASFPLFVTLLAPLLLGETRRAVDLWAALAVSAGLALLVPAWSFGDRALQGLLWGIASGLAFALLTIANRRFARGSDPVRLAFAQNAVAALVLAPLVNWPLVDTPGQWGLLALLGVVFTALSHTLFIASLHGVRAQSASVVVALEPIYGIVLAGALLGEVPSLREAAGAAVIIGATVWATRARGRAATA